jgi:hypothetical protein
MKDIYNGLALLLSDQGVIESAKDLHCWRSDVFLFIKTQSSAWKADSVEDQLKPPPPQAQAYIDALTEVGDVCLFT